MGAESFKVVWASSDDGAISINQLLVAGKHCITREENANSKYRSVINKTEGRLEEDQLKSLQSHVGGKKREQTGQLTKACNRYLARSRKPGPAGLRGEVGGQGKHQLGRETNSRVTSQLLPLR